MSDDVFFAINEDMPEPAQRQVAGGLATCFTTRCPGKPTLNEDAAAVIALHDSAGVLVVADGVGGSPAGHQASAIAVRELAQTIVNRFAHNGDSRAAILEGFDTANRAVLDLGSGAATTLAVVELCAGVARPYHAGDSEILIVGQRGRIAHQTVPHSPVGYAIEAGLLDEHEAMTHEHRHIISNMVGAPDMHVTVGPAVKLKRRDTVMLASDGLSDNLAPSEILERIRAGKAERIANDLIAIAQHRMFEAKHDEPGKPDDLTFVLFRMT